MSLFSTTLFGVRFISPNTGEIRQTMVARYLEATGLLSLSLENTSSLLHKPLQSVAATNWFMRYYQSSANEWLITDLSVDRIKEIRKLSKKNENETHSGRQLR